MSEVETNTKARPLKTMDDERNDDTNTHNNDDADPFTKALRECEWDECLKILEGLDEERRAARSNDSSRGWTVLHWCLYQKAPVSVLRAVRRTWPSAFEPPRGENDGDGDGCWWRNPVAHACLRGDDDAIAYLASEIPHAVAVPQEPFGRRLSLHNAVTTRRSASVIERLLSIHPTSVWAVTGNDDDTPFDLFVLAWRGYVERELWRRRNVESETTNTNTTTTTTKREITFRGTLSLLLAAHARGSIVGATDQDPSRGLLALDDNDVARTSIPSAVVRLVLLGASRAEIARPDDEGNLALHLVCARRPFGAGS